MIYIVRNADRTIKTFLERGDDYILQAGESMEISPLSFQEFAGRLRLSVGGTAAQLIRVQKEAGPVEVQVEAPLAGEVALRINDTVEVVTLQGGRGSLWLGSGEAGTFLIEPADRTSYCAAGEAILTVEVVE
jgi:ssDNA-binding replication factor A large subunit